MILLAVLHSYKFDQNRSLDESAEKIFFGVILRTFHEKF